ncbi:receptor-like protein 39 [Wolffia australiana]
MAISAFPAVVVFSRPGDNPFNPTLSFPEELSTMTKLKSLYLSNCGIQALELADNLLHDEIPREISNLEKLWQLELYKNSLTGMLPPGFGKLLNLVYLGASMNNLQGDLSKIRYLTKLVWLQLFQNNFYSVSTNLLSGPIPPQMCKNSAMTRLFMLENRFSGEIPVSYGFCESLIRFRVSKNLLSVEIPLRIWALPRVNIINLAMNNFSEKSEKGLGRKALSQLSISGN